MWPITQLHQINIAVPGFLSSPPPGNTHPVELPTQRASKEEVTSSNPVPKEEATKVIQVVDSSEDFDEDLGVFDQSFPTESLLATFSPLPFA